MPKTTPAADARRYYTIKDAADFHGIHPQTLRRWIAQGRLTAYRVGPHLIRLDAVEVEQLGRIIPTARRSA